MTILAVFVGLGLIGGALWDALWTTLAAAGGGPITTRLSQWLWAVALRVHRHLESHRLLTLAGTVILLAAIALWIIMLWTGYFLLFTAEPEAVVQANSRAPADLWSRVYFTGYTLFTLGIGDYVPGAPVWQVITAVASLNGLFLITLSITYLVPVLSAVAAKRQLAASIAHLGMTPQELLRNGWDGKSFQPLTQPFTQLASMIEMHAQRHLAYPVLHFFHSQDPRTAVAPRLAALSEALLLITADDRPSRSPQTAVQSVRRAIDGFLNTLDTAFVHPADQMPPLPDVEELRRADILHEHKVPLDETARRYRQHRRLLLGLVQNDGWDWSAVTAPPQSFQDIAS